MAKKTVYDAVLFLRVPESLLEGLDRIVDTRREERPGHVMSRSDIAREILMEHLAQEPKREPKLRAKKR